MIEVIARGPIEITESYREHSEYSDEIYANVDVTKRRDVTVDLEFPDGHVNLEGYVQTGDYTIRMCIGGYVRKRFDGDIRYIDEEWTIELRGEYWDWVEQAHRYVVERPAESIVSCLERFAQWEETETDWIDEAILQAHDVSEHATTPIGELCDHDWRELQLALNEIDNVEIPIPSIEDPQPA